MIGSGTSAGDDLLINTQQISNLSLGLSYVEINTQANADDASDKLSAAIDRLSDIRANIGATQNCLDFSSSNSDTAV